MGKNNKQSTTSATPVVNESKQPKTFKRSSVYITIGIIVAVITGYVGGVISVNFFQDTVHAQAVELSKHLK